MGRIHRSCVKAIREYTWLLLLLLLGLSYGVVLAVLAKRDGGFGYQTFRQAAEVFWPGFYLNRVEPSPFESLLAVVWVLYPVLGLYAVADLITFLAGRQCHQAMRPFFIHIGLPIGLVIMVIVVCSHSCYYAGLGESTSDLVFTSLRLIQMEENEFGNPVRPMMNTMRFLAPLITLFAVIVGFWKYLKKLFLETCIRMRADNIIVCGLGNKGYVLAQKLYLEGRRVVVIEIDEENEHVTAVKSLGIPVLFGNAENREMLMKAAVLRASHLILVTDSDSSNMNILMCAASIMKEECRGRRKIEVVLHMEDPDLCPLLREEKAMEQIRRQMRIKVINVAEMAARDIFSRDVINRMPAEPTSKEGMHFIIVGFGWLGQAIALQAARMSHLAGRPNYCRTAGKSDGGAERGLGPFVWCETKDQGLLNPHKIRITVADCDRAKVEGFLEKYPAFSGLCDLCTEPLLLEDIKKPRTLERLLQEIQRSANPVESANCIYQPSVFFTMGDDYLNLKTALHLSRELDRGGVDGHKDIPFYVELLGSEGLAQLLNEENSETSWARRLTGFGAIEQVFSPQAVLGDKYDQIAKYFHEQYSSEEPWEEQPFLLRDSNRQAADHSRVKLKAMGYRAVAISSRRIRWKVQSQIRRIERAEKEGFRILQPFGEEEPFDTLLENLLKISRFPLEEKLRAIDLICQAENPAKRGGSKVAEFPFRLPLAESPDLLMQIEHCRWCAEKNLFGYRFGYMDRGSVCGADGLDHKTREQILEYSRKMRSPLKRIKKTIDATKDAAKKERLKNLYTTIDHSLKVKDNDKLFNIDLVPWEYLDQTERRKDIDQVTAICRAYLKANLLPMKDDLCRKHEEARRKGDKAQMKAIEQAALDHLRFSRSNDLTEKIQKQECKGLTAIAK